MGKVTDILNIAQQRAKEMNLQYEGAMTPQEAYEVWKSALGARLVDVRSRVEMDFVGRIPGVVEIEWALTFRRKRGNTGGLCRLLQRVDCLRRGYERRKTAQDGKQLAGARFALGAKLGG